MSIRGRRAPAASVLLIAVLATSSLTCALPESWNAGPLIRTLAGPLIDEEKQRIPIAEAEARAHAAETAYALSLTQAALEQLLLAQEAATAPPTIAHAPVIVSVVLPGRVPVDGSTARGTVNFTDAGRDVNLMSLQTLVGTFGTGNWDPTSQITWNGNTGSIPFGGICGRAETVRATITLKDAAGATSVPAQLTFTCQ